MGRWLALLLVALLGAGLLLIPLPTGAPATPVYEVVRGDTLSTIARRFGTTPQQLRDWNGLEGDLIVPGQRLRVGAEPDRVPAWRALASWWDDDDGPPDPTGGGTSPRVRSRAPRTGSAPGPAAGADEAEVARSPAPLSLPPARPCLEEAAGIEADASFGRSQGLEPGQVQTAVTAFQHEALRCYTDGVGAAGEVVLALAVGCDGRVRRSSVQRDDTGDAGFASCVAETFRYAPFPAHARDEVELLVPLRFTAP